MGFYSASTALYPRLTARETIEFFARINQYPEDKVQERVDALIVSFGITEYAGVRVEKLSTGMKQKVSIARTDRPQPAHRDLRRTDSRPRRPERHRSSKRHPGTSQRRTGRSFSPRTS